MPRQVAPITRRAVIAGLAAAAASANLRGGRATEPVGAETADAAPYRDFNIRDYGARGDGKADDTAAFRALHRHLMKVQRQLPQLRLDIHLPNGHYRYNWNQWLWGLRQVRVIGEGASLQCISDSPWDVAKFALTTNGDPLAGRDPGDGSGASPPNFGRLIHTAEAGSRVIELVTPANGKRFTPGRYVCILSFDQQFGGYPPNCRYFEYAVIEAVSAGSITLDRPLQFDHSDRNFEDPAVPESIGRARVVSIDWPDQPLARRQEIRGIKIVANPHARDYFTNVFQAIGFCDLQIRDCSLINLVTSLGQRCEIVDTDVEFAEPDKLVSEVEFRNCRIGRISQATGIHYLKLVNCRVDRTSDMQARYVRAAGCEFRGAAYPDDALGLSLEGFTPTRLLEVTDSVFVGKGGKQDLAVGWNRPVAISLTDPIMVIGNVIRIPFNDERARILLSILEAGDIVLLGSEFAGTVFSDGRSGRIESIDLEGADIAIRTTAPAKRGDTLFTFRVRQVRFHGNQYRDILQSPPLSLATSWDDRVDNSSSYRWTFASGDFAQILLSCPGRIERITVDVVRPYRGQDPTAFLILTTRTPAFATIVAAIDLTQAGRRSATASEATGSIAGDAWKPIAHGTIVWDFYMHHSDTASGWHRQLAGTADQQAKYLLAIDTVPFWQTDSFHREQYPL
jgi:hypothetical protein